jgi:hypothetical protein
MAEPLGPSLPVNPSSGIDHRLHQSLPVNPVAPRHDGSSGAAAESVPSTEFHLGTTVEALVRGPPSTPSAAALPIGTKLLLRIVALPPAPPPALLIGRVIESGGPETFVDTAFGLLAVQRRLALARDTIIAFEPLEQIAPEQADDRPVSTAGGWPALDEAIALLAEIAPQLATQLRALLSPQSGAQLAGSLLFLLGALYHGDWPGTALGTALAGATHEKLAKRIADDAEGFRRLAEDAATGEWRVLTLPLSPGGAVIPLRLFLRRRRPNMPTEEAIRFAIEVELSRLGPLQLDGLLRATHLILVLRAHRSLPQALREETASVCRRALLAWGLTGDLSFATTREFALTPLSSLRRHVQVSV